jgi:hypothetical protein
MSRVKRFGLKANRIEPLAELASKVGAKSGPFLPIIGGNRAILNPFDQRIHFGSIRVVRGLLKPRADGGESTDILASPADTAAAAYPT